MRIIDTNLESSSPVAMQHPFGTDITSALALAMDQSFLVAYSLWMYPGDDHRAMVVRRDGTLESDTAADPIAEGDRIGNRYLVARPSGTAAIAEDDPRRIISPAIDVKRRVYENWSEIDTVISGDVTLVGFGEGYLTRFVRVDSAGLVIDQEPISQLGTPIATPGGFAFLSKTNDTVTLRRLTRREGWVDSEPKTIASVPGAIIFAAHANDRDLIVVWTTYEEILWLRFELDGTPLQQEPSRIAHAPRDDYAGEPSEIAIAGRDDERLLLVHQCNFGCLEALTLGGDGHPLGLRTAVNEAHASSEGVGLSDGSWVVPIFTRSWEALHLARDASLLDRTVQPLLNGGLGDITPTANGWKTLVGGNPNRIVELDGALVGFDGAGVVASVVRLSGVRQSRFGAGNLLAFVEASPDFESVSVPWVGRLSASEGDLAIHLTDLGRYQNGQLLRVAVRNEGAEPATNISVTSLPYFGWELLERVRIPSLEPGAAFLINGIVYPTAYYDPWFLVLADDVVDTDASDNFVTASSAEPRSPGRGRPTRREE